MPSRCKCGKQSNYGLPGESAKWCKTCKSPDAINVRSHKCPCGIRPSLNLLGETIAIWCKSCPTKPVEAISVIGKKCPCSKTPSFNLPGEINGKWCKTCPSKPEGAVDVVNYKCPCGTMPSFNLPGEVIAIWCKNCKSSEAIDVISRKCKCGIRPIFNLPGEVVAIWCSKCKESGAVNVTHKLCIECNIIRVTNPQYKDHCLRCFIYKFPDDKITSNYKIKEKHVFDAVLKLLPEDTTLVRDKIIAGGCSKRRPDLMIDCGSHWICAENDEDAHKDYDTTCENKRTMELYQDMGNRPMIIRFNCDKTPTLNGLFKTHKTLGVVMIRDQKEFDGRIGVFANCIKKYLTVQPEKAITIEYLFYD